MTGGRGHARFRNFLIVAQFALAMVLLTGAALYIRAFDELNNTRGGWSSERLVTGTIVLPSANYGDAERINTFHRISLERLGAIPGVATVAISSFTPFFNWSDVRKYIVEGRELPPPGREPAAVVNSISPAYFEAYQTRLLSGRAFSDRDSLTSPKVFIVSQAMAVALFGNENPIGRRLAQTGLGPAQWGEIVGVAGDVQSVLPDSGPVTLQLYQPMTQEPRPYNEIVVRCASGSPSALVASIRNVMSGLDPDLPVRQLQPADVTIERANTQTAILRDMLTAFAIVGLGLASLGIYGVIARTMAQRTGEFAIRFAMGACISDITKIVLTAGLRLAACGLAVGFVGALGLARLLGSMNSGMHFANPTAFIAPILLLVVIALVACWLPARRAGRINPIEALRAE
jgi:predicted permease